VRTPHQFGEFAVHNTHQGLTGSKAAEHLLANRFFLDAGNQIPDHRQRDIGFQQGHPHFAQSIRDVVFRQTRLSAQRLDDAGEALRQIIQHDVPIAPGRM